MVWMDNYDKAMSEAGVDANTRETKAYSRIKQACQKNPEIFIGESLSDTLKEAAIIAGELKKLTAESDWQCIPDADLRNALSCYNATLTITKSIFGKESMTEAVICKAIEAGSYIAYRAIMGEAATPYRRS